MKQQSESFDLVVFDHHADLLLPRFEGLLSCGSWIRQAFEDYENMNQVILIGVSDELSHYGKEEYGQRLTIFSESDIKNEDWLQSFASLLNRPLYLSIDKDVFSKKELITDWDQGTMTLNQFSCALDKIHQKVPVLAVDICGEYNSISGGAFQVEETDRMNSRFNGRILELLKNR